MDKELQNKLFEKYPSIFVEKDLPVSKSCMGRGIETGNGWYDIIDDLCGTLLWIEKKSGIKMVAKQVKRKFAALRFYLPCDSEIDKGNCDKADFERWMLIATTFLDGYERSSSHTCEYCGCYIEEKIVDALTGWHYAACKECYLKNKKKEDEL